MFSTVLLLAGCGWRPPEASPARPPAVLARAPTGAPDLTVDCNGAGDHPTISAAISAAANGAWIEVLPCTYNERIDYRGKTLWISSTGGSAVTTIDAGGNGSAVSAKNGEGDRTALVGFTLDDADNQAVDVELSALRLQDVVITDTDGAYAIRSLSGDLELADVVIDASNDAFSWSVFADRGSVAIRGGSVTCGSGGGLHLGHGGFLLDAVDVSCTGNDLAIDVEHAVGRIQRSDIHGDVEILTEEDHLDDLIRMENVAMDGDVRVEFGTFTLRNAVATGTLSFVDVADTVTIENTVFVGPGCAIDSNVPLGPVRYNDFSVGPSTCNGAPSLVGVDNNVALAPLFVNAAAGDLHLQAASPLIDAGVPEASYRDVDGTPNDLGLYGGRFTQDGGW